MRTYVSRAVFLFLLPFATVLAGSCWRVICSYASSQVTRVRCRMRGCMQCLDSPARGISSPSGFSMCPAPSTKPGCLAFLSLSLCVRIGSWCYGCVSRSGFREPYIEYASSRALFQRCQFLSSFRWYSSSKASSSHLYSFGCGM